MSYTNDTPQLTNSQSDEGFLAEALIQMYALRVARAYVQQDTEKAAEIRAYIKANYGAPALDVNGNLAAQMVLMGVL